MKIEFEKLFTIWQFDWCNYQMVIVTLVLSECPLNNTLTGHSVLHGLQLLGS